MELVLNGKPLKQGKGQQAMEGMHARAAFHRSGLIDVAVDTNKAMSRPWANFLPRGEDERVAQVA